MRKVLIALGSSAHGRAYAGRIYASCTRHGSYMLQVCYPLHQSKSCQSRLITAAVGLWVRMGLHTAANSVAWAARPPWSVRRRVVTLFVVLCLLATCTLNRCLLRLQSSRLLPPYIYHCRESKVIRDVCLQLFHVRRHSESIGTGVDE